MTLEESLELARRELKIDETPSIEEAYEAMKEAVSNCWFCWITGQNAVDVLRKNL